MSRATGFIICALAVLLIATATVVVVSWPADPVDRWVAVGGASTFYYTVITGAAVLVASLAGRAALEQVAADRRRARLDLGPYLRIDLAPDEEGGTFKAPDSSGARSFNFSDFNPGVAQPANALSAWEIEDGIPIRLWIRNQQRHPAGVAVNVRVGMELLVAGEEDSVPELVPYEVILHYLEPDTSLTYTVARVDPAVPILRGRITTVQYFDLHQRERHFAHGSTGFEREHGALRNHREALYGNEDD